MTPADGHPYEDETAGLLIEASFDLVAKGGWADFSLRAVAESIGAAGSAASHRFGDRAGLVTAVCDAAIAREAAQMNGFMPAFVAENSDELVAVLYEWLEQRVRWNRKQARSCGELLLVSYRDPAFRSFGLRWADLCRRLIARLHPSLSQDAVQALAAFLSAEIPYWLLLADDPEFRLQSQEALRRVARLGAGAEGKLPTAWLRRGLAQPDARRPAGLTGTKLRIIEATAQVIADSGVQAVTHREIAKRSEASLSSLTYHFESLEDLIRHGFQLQFAASGGPPPPKGPNRAIVPYELVLQALRDPFLAPLAASVRRGFGEGLFARKPEADPQAAARREADIMLETALTLTGESSGWRRRPERAVQA